MSCPKKSRTIRTFLGRATVLLVLAFSTNVHALAGPLPSDDSPQAGAKKEPPAKAPAEAPPEGAEKPELAGEGSAEAPLPADEAASGETVSETDAAGQAGAVPPAMETEVEPAAAEEPPPAAAEPAPETPAGKKSVTSNQSVEPPKDDYEGASDAALVEEKKGPSNLSLGIALDLTLPLGKTANFISNASVQGLSLDLRYYAWGNIGIGVGVALDSLSKKSTATTVWENATLTGTQVREQSYTPILAKAYYSWRDSERFVPYVAGGIGIARAVRRVIVGFSSLSQNSWHFAVAPEAGLQIPAGPTVLLTNVRLNYLPASAGAEEQLFANFSVGLSIQ